MCCSWHRSSFSPSLFYSSTNMETRRGSGKYLPSHNWSPAQHFSACGSLREETTYLIKIHLLSTLDTPPLDCLSSHSVPLYQLASRSTTSGLLRVSFSPFTSWAGSCTPFIITAIPERATWKGPSACARFQTI